MYFISICLICDRINSVRYSKHKLSTIYMLYTIKKLSNYPLTSPCLPCGRGGEVYCIRHNLRLVNLVIIRYYNKKKIKKCVRQRLAYF